MPDFSTWDAYDLLEALELSGEKPDPELIRAIQERRDDVTPGLLDMLARGTQSHWEPDDPRWYRDAHAGLLLIAFREEKALPLFEEILRDPEREQLVAEWFEVWLPDYGPALVPSLIAVVQDEDVFEEGRMRAIRLLGMVGMHHPETRETVAPVLRGQLPELQADGTLAIDPDEATPEDVEHWTWTASALEDIRDRESLARVAALYEADLIDAEIIGSLDDYRETMASAPPEVSTDQTILDYYEKLDEWSDLSDADLAEAVENELLEAGLDPEQAEAMRADMMSMFGQNLAEDDEEDVGLGMLQQLVQQLRAAGMSEREIDAALGDAVAQALGETGGDPGEVQSMLDLIKGGEEEMPPADLPPRPTTYEREQPKIGRNDVVTIRDPETGETQTLKYKHAQKKLGDGWELLGLAEE